MICRCHHVTELHTCCDGINEMVGRVANLPCIFRMAFALLPLCCRDSAAVPGLAAPESGAEERRNKPIKGRPKTEPGEQQSADRRPEPAIANL